MYVKIRPAIPEDLVTLTRIERSSPTAAHWSKQQYHQAMSGARELPEQTLLVAVAADSVSETGKAKTSAASPQARRQARGTEKSYEVPAQAELGRGTLVGFLVARHVRGEWELENIVVSAELRGRGIGKRLLDGLLARVRETESWGVFLEVRESNVGARKFYQKAGFREIGRRKSYYADPAEDAVLYRLDAE
jgi:ribosomal-protein-alanine acetyltransferase